MFGGVRMAERGARVGISAARSVGGALLVAAGLGACDIPPSYVERSGDIDIFLVNERFKSACVGMDMPDEDLRRYTAMKLADYPQEEVANSCICEALYDPELHSWDAAVADGLRNTERDDLAACLASALSDDQADERERLVHMLAGIHAPSGYAAIAEAAASERDPEVKAAMISELQPSDSHVDVVLAALKSDDSPAVRAAAARALKGRKDPAVVEAVVHAATEDPEGEVRAAALRSVVKLKVEKTDEMVCAAMMEDEDEAVRLMAVRSYKGTRRPEALACLRKRARSEEESGAVRQAILDALGASPSDEAADILCEIVGPWSRMYIKDKIYVDIPGADVMKAQNNRDWERSYQCVAEALRQGGYSCYARNYLGHWMKDLGGSAATPWCPGMKKL